MDNKNIEEQIKEEFIDYLVMSIIFKFCTKKSVKNCTSYIFFLSKTSALSLSL